MRGAHLWEELDWADEVQGNILNRKGRKESKGKTSAIICILGGSFLASFAARGFAPVALGFNRDSALDKQVSVKPALEFNVFID